MKYVIGTVIAALALLGSTVAQSALITYEGTITPSATVGGSIGGFGWVREDATDVDFWRFMGIAGNSVTIRGTRLNVALDPALDLYFGTTTADDSLFRTGQSWGGMQFLVSADDEVDAPPGGPFGDPLISFLRLPFTGNYTIAIGGAGSVGEGPYAYSLSVQVVPIPGTAWLVLAGLAGIARTRRRSHLQ